MKNSPFRNSSSITCGCIWTVRLRGVHYNKHKVSDPVFIMLVCRTRFNTSYSYYDE